MNAGDTFGEMKRRYVRRSATGLVRGNNEDSLLCLPERGLFVVADGMGGGDEGEKASAMVCAGIEKDATAAAFMTRLEQIDASVAETNAEIIAYTKKKHLRQMGSTVALMAFEGDGAGRAALAYAGDSRVYRFRAGKAERLTRDHTVGAELALQVGGKLGEAYAARSNPLAHVLTRVIGVEPEAGPDWKKLDVRAGDRYLLCSDGVHDVIADAFLASACAEGELETCAEKLEKEILRLGAPDNYSFILIAC